MNILLTDPRTTETLRSCPVGMDVVIDSVKLDDVHRFRLSELGLREGLHVRVAQRCAFGGRLVARGTERIAVDSATATSIVVRSASGKR